MAGSETLGIENRLSLSATSLLVTLIGDIWLLTPNSSFGPKVGRLGDELEITDQHVGTPGPLSNSYRTGNKTIFGQHPTLNPKPEP